MATLTSTLLQQQEQVETGSGRLSDDDHEAVGSDSAIDDNRSQYSLKYPAYVVIFNLIMFIALLSSAVFSKTAFVSIALRLRINSTYAGADSMSHNYKRQSVAFVQLVLILCVPQIATFIKCLLFGALKSRKGHPWPLLCSLIMGIFVSTLEAVCLSMFAILIATQADPEMTFILSSTLIISANLMSCSEDSSKYLICLNVLRVCSIAAVILSLIAISVVFVFCPPSEKSNINDAFCISNKTQLCHVTAILSFIPFTFLSILWSPCVQRFIFRSAHKNGHPMATYKAGALYAFIRLVSMPFICFGFVTTTHDQFQPDIGYGFTQWESNDYTVFFVQIFCSMSTQILSLIALWSTYEVFSFTLPLVLSSLVSIIWFWAGFWKEPLWSIFPFVEKPPVQEAIYWYIIMAFVSVLSLFIGSSWSTTSGPIDRAKNLFLSPYYDGIFLDSFLVLNRTNAQLLQKISMANISSAKHACRVCSKKLYHEIKEAGEDCVRECCFPCCQKCNGDWCRNCNWFAKIKQKFCNCLECDGQTCTSSHSCCTCLNKIGSCFVTHCPKCCARVLCKTDVDSVEDRNTSKHDKAMIYICTTMYRETKKEMKRLLHSLENVANRQKLNNIMVASNVEAHIFVDNAIDSELNEDHSTTERLGKYANRLKNLIDNTKVKSSCYKTPYGGQLKCTLQNMKLFVHFKNSEKVKKKKRWSQVMYMKYIIDHKFKDKKEQLGNRYIVTTDGDVSFDPKSIEVLLDFMKRDNSVGAVCGITHPIGSGYMYWYQKFEYQLGHWFQKSTEHILGSVLCCPGCFSIFRAKALVSPCDQKQVTTSVKKSYATEIKSPIEFLKKDMGEDRWLCTLLIENGWKLEYAALAENETNCPNTFENFFIQRRRWVSSTIANLTQVIGNSLSITSTNESVTCLCILYQIMVLISTAISPATVILVIASGLSSTSLHVNQFATVVVLSIVSCFYIFICLTTGVETQHFWAKLLSVVFGFLMAIGFIAIIVDSIEIIVELIQKGTRNSSQTTVDIVDGPLISAGFLFSFLLLVFLAGILHFFFSISSYLTLFWHFTWYILLIPTAYHLLIIYTACNLHERSWGTREKTNKDKKGKNNTALKQFWKDVKQKATMVWKHVFRSNPCEEEVYLTHSSNKSDCSSDSDSSDEEAKNIYDEEIMINPRFEDWEELEEGENEFWVENLKVTTDLAPSKKSEEECEKGETKKDKKLNRGLERLRSKSVMVLLFINGVWLNLVLIIRAAVLLSHFHLAESPPFALIYLGIYFLIFLLQFACLFVHRLETFFHFLARANQGDLAANKTSRYRMSGSQYYTEIPTTETEC